MTDCSQRLSTSSRRALTLETLGTYPEWSLFGCAPALAGLAALPTTARCLSLVAWHNRNPGKLLAAYRSAVRARMLIPVGLAVAMLAYNTLRPDEPLSLTQEVRFCMPNVRSSLPLQSRTNTIVS